MQGRAQAWGTSSYHRRAQVGRDLKDDVVPTPILRGSLKLEQSGKTAELAGARERQGE